MTRWNEADHPRDGDGRFTDSWVGRVSDAIGTSRGLQRAQDPDEFQREYQPGRWLVEDRETMLEQARRETWEFIDSDPSLRQQYSQAELEQMVQDQAAMLVPANPGKKLRNGPHQIHWTDEVTVSDGQIEFLSRRVDQLQADHPIQGPISISVVPQRNMMGEQSSKARGQTLRGTGRIFLSELIFRPDAQQEGDAGFMPSYATHGVVDYTLTHEWGHALDHNDDSEAMHQWGQSLDGVSEYGLLAPREAFAEAFAEWALTRGGTSNQSAKAYASRNGWSA